MMSSSPSTPMDCMSLAYHTAFLTPGSGVGLYQSGSHGFVPEQLTDFLIFHGFQIQQVPGDQIKEDAGVAPLKGGDGAEPSEDKRNGDYRQVPGMKQLVGDQDDAGSEQQRDPHDGSPEKRPDDGPVRHRDQSDQHIRCRLVKCGSDDIRGQARVNSGKNIESYEKSDKNKDVIAGVEHQRHRKAPPPINPTHEEENDQTEHVHPPPGNIQRM